MSFYNRLENQTVFSREPQICFRVIQQKRGSTTAFFYLAEHCATFTFNYFTGSNSEQQYHTLRRFSSPAKAI